MGAELNRSQFHKLLVLTLFLHTKILLYSLWKIKKKTERKGQWFNVFFSLLFIECTGKKIIWINKKLEKLLNFFNFKQIFKKKIFIEFALIFFLVYFTKAVFDFFCWVKKFCPKFLVQEIIIFSSCKVNNTWGLLWLSSPSFSQKAPPVKKKNIFMIYYFEYLVKSNFFFYLFIFPIFKKVVLLLNGQFSYRKAIVSLILLFCMRKISN